MWAGIVPSGYSGRMPSLRGNPCPYAGRSEVRSALLGGSVTFLICLSHHLLSFFSRLRNLSREEFFVSFLASLQKAGLFVIGVFCAVFKSCQTREGISICFGYQRQLWKMTLIAFNALVTSVLVGEPSVICEPAFVPEK